MKSLIFLALLCIGVVFFLMLFVSALTRPRSSTAVEEAWPFYGKRVLTDAEQVFYWRLVEALPDSVVLAQVQLSRFLGVCKGNQRIQWLNRVSQKSADFVVCAKDFSVVAVIELDDASHARASRQKADFDKAKAIADAGLRLVRWTVKSMPTAGQIRDEIYPPASLAASVEVGRGVGAEPLRIPISQPGRSGAHASRRDPPPAL
ncbi:MAG: DUF2726 domain-containing protein [Pseudomonas sp.]